MSHQYVETADPSWYPRVLRTLERDYPQISEEVWSVAITENAKEQVTKAAALAAARTDDPFACIRCYRTVGGSSGHPGASFPLGDGQGIGYIHHVCPDQTTPAPTPGRPLAVEYRALRTDEAGKTEDGQCLGCSRELPNPVNGPNTGDRVPPSLVFLNATPPAALWDVMGLCPDCLPALKELSASLDDTD